MLSHDDSWIILAFEWSVINTGAIIKNWSRKECAHLNSIHRSHISALMSIQFDEKNNIQSQCLTCKQTEC